MTRENFLPEFSLAETPAKGRNKVQCQVRGYDVPATPEERVRQRVLHWLIHGKGWSNLRLEEAYRWESDPNRHFVRPDIELLDDEGNVVVVVECKHEDVPLSKAVDDQAIEYAIKSGAPYIWTTNGKEHRFLIEDSDVPGRWTPVSSIPPLGEEYEPPTGRIEFPNMSGADEIKQYLEDMDLATLNDPALAREREFTLALHKVVFDAAVAAKLPYSHGGVHVLEYSGVAFREFSNRSGGSYHTRYADFVAATRGRVEALSVAVNIWWADNSIRLCVGVSKANRKHHALQLDFTNCCEWSEERHCWDVYHDGKMSQVRRAVVLDAVREAGCGHWILADEAGNEWVYLGELPKVESASWKSARKFMANLLHYGIIRTNLREARAA